MKLEAGARVPHGSTALGRADLAARPLELFERRLAEFEMECEPGYWPKLRAGIVRARADYEHYGFCFSLGDWNPEVFAVGVPMVSADRSRVLTFNCSGRVSVMTPEADPGFRAAAGGAAQQGLRDDRRTLLIERGR